jgi:hypothetical protein
LGESLPLGSAFIPLQESRRHFRLDDVTAELPVTVRSLLENGVNTFEKLELIVLLHGAPRSVMSLAELTRRLRLESEVVRLAAAELRDAALVELSSTGELQLLPPTSRDYEAVDELVRLYAEDRLAIVKAIGEIAMGRIRTLASQAFAEAFVVRKNRGDA